MVDIVKDSIGDRSICIPFEVSLNIPNEETRKAIEDAEKGIGLSKAYDTVEEAMKAMQEEA